MAIQRTAGSQMLIRKPQREVFNAFMDPDVTTRFWFTESSGRLKEGASVEWTWGQFGVSALINVKKIEQGQLIRFDWPAPGGVNRTVDITFEPQPKETTFVKVTEKGFASNDESLIEEISDQTEGWALVLSSLKAYLEHGLNLKLIGDHKPTQ